jgi:hypothetical protein
VQIAGHEGDGKAVIAAVSQSLSTIAAIPPSPSTIAALLPSPGTIATIPPGPSTTPSAVVSPPSPAKSTPAMRAPAVSAPVKRQESASQSNSPQVTRLDAFAPAVTAPTTEASTTAATTAEQPAPAPKKSQKAGRGGNERNRGWNDAAGWGRYGHERPTSSWWLNLHTAPALGITLLPTLHGRRRDSAAAVNNDFQNHSFARRRDPDFPLRTLGIFPTNDASQRGS